jgi:apolipoprotein N-acyltransferase
MFDARLARPHGGFASLAARVANALDAQTARLSRLKGWRRRLAAIAAGAATALAFAPYYLLPLMAAGFTAFVVLLDAAVRDPRPLRTASMLGWLFGFGYHLVGVYWMAFSFFVQADQFAWMAPFAILGMPSFLALFAAAAAALYARFRSAGWRRIFLFAAIWMGVEFARGNVLTGLPWNLPGQALAGAAAGAQTAAIYGVYGLSLVCVLAAAAPAAFEKTLKGIGAATAVIAGLFLFGAIRLAAPGPGVRDDVALRIVQPNIAQRDKINDALWADNFLKHLSLSSAPSTAKTLYVVWPENATSYIDQVPQALDRLSTDLPERAILITGNVRAETDASGAERYYNAVSVLEETANGRRVAATYDKHHLVPFGEYLPLKSALKAVGLAQLAPYEDGFTPGAGPAVLAVGGTRFAPLICYEAIFPGALYPDNDRPEWLVTVTNDAWFGDTSGPRQHLDQARLRAIESGLPMARSANTGISALIDSRGRYVARIRLYQSGVIDAPLPLPGPRTLFDRFGQAPFLAMLALCLWIGVRRRNA